MTALAAAALCVAVGVVVSRPAGGATITTIDHTVGQAVSYAESVGVTSAVAVLDDRTGKLYTAGDATSYYGAASVMKLFVATRLLATGQMSNATIAAQAWAMITRSDDKALETLLPRVGGTSVIDWVKSRYGISFLGAPTRKAGCWGNTQISAKGIAYFYSRMKRDSRVAPWLLNALHHYQAYAAVGTHQTFGIPQAATGVGIKQGWGHCSSNTNGSVVHSTGLVAANRFAVVILTNTNEWAPNGHAFNGTQAYVVSQMAKILMPHGVVDLPEAHNPVGHVDSMAAEGSTVTVRGWALDPDIRSGSMTVQVTEGTGVRWEHATSVLRPDVNQLFHTTGDHGFDAEFAASTGQHAYCVRFINYGAGNGSPAVCHIVTVPGTSTSSPTSAPPSTSPVPAASTASALPGAPPPSITASTPTAARRITTQPVAPRTSAPSSPPSSASLTGSSGASPHPTISPEGS